MTPQEFIDLAKHGMETLGYKYREGTERYNDKAIVVGFFVPSNSKDTVFLTCSARELMMNDTKERSIDILKWRIREAIYQGDRLAEIEGKTDGQQ